MCFIKKRFIPSLFLFLYESILYMSILNKLLLHLFSLNFNLKKEKNSQKKKFEKKIRQICPFTQYFLHNYKVSRNSDERFQTSCD